MTKQFSHLHCHSAYSLLDSVAKIPDLIAKAKADGQAALALSDHGNMFGHVDFYRQCKKAGIKAIIANEMYIVPNHLDKGEDKKGKKKKEEEDSFISVSGPEAVGKKRFHITVIAKNNVGYKNLLKLTSISNQFGFYYKPCIDINLLKQYREGLIVLSGCLGSEVNQYIINDMFDKAEETIKAYKDIFGDDYYLEVMNHGDALEEKIRNVIPKFAKKYGIKIVATNDVHYVNKEDVKVHDLIIAIRDHKLLSDPNLKRYEAKDLYLRTREEMYELFKENPEYCEATVEIADKCDVIIEPQKNTFPEFVEGEDKKKDLIRKLCKDGWDKKVKPLLKSEEDKKLYSDRVKYELDVITKNGFVDYFLVVQDFVNWAKDNRIRVGRGRGSVGGSIVSYLLNITGLNPIKYDLSFERFLNEGRISKPDIDLDFMDSKRELVIEYARNRYGKNRLAKMVTFGNFQPKMAIRDVFKACGHSLEVATSVSNLVPSVIQGIPNLRFKHLYGQDPGFEYAIQPELLKAKEKYPEEFYLAEKIEGNPRQVSTHASAYILTRNDLDTYCPLDWDASSKDIRVAVDMHSAEYLDLVKIDFLGLETLTILDNALSIIKNKYNIEIDLENLDENDQKTWDLFKKGDTIGIFQFESDGMRNLLKKAKPATMTQLGDCNAIYRPGAAKFIDDYCAVKNGTKDLEAFHPLMEPVLKSTYGILIYQESISKMCEVLAGFSPSDADYMRKAIGKKKQEDMDVLKPKFEAGCRKQGIDEQIIEKTLSWFSDMSRYNFNKAHALGYSTGAYDSAYVKSNYPFEFAIAMLNKKTKELSDYLTRYQDALKRNIKVKGPNINLSNGDCSEVVTDGKSRIYFGLDLIKGVSSATTAKILEERKNGEFKNPEDFLKRCWLFIDAKTIEGLVNSGALDSLGINRRALTESLEDILKLFRKLKVRLTKDKYKEEDLVIEVKDIPEFTRKEKLDQEKESVGFYVSGSPLEDYQSMLLSDDYTNVLEFNSKLDGEFIKMGCIISDVREFIDKNKNTMAFCTLEDNFGSVKGTMFSTQYPKYKSLMNKKIPVEISGRISKGSVLINTIKKLIVV